ncbi:MAG: succinyldiaminopimelate transaminase [Gammaproteobacteria bacterium]|nr:MAG: succinyldiaminopimelate transaminase [Gammaproteobacteria bacterium]UCH41551.1 MAG: succinyldiaminopimelate transaminase [Gammaproteobacteria bacterium]
MNKDLDRLHRYPFEKLAELKQGLQPPHHLDHIALSIGEPQHPAPHFVIENLIAHLHQLSSYPSTKGSQQLRQAIAGWLSRRFDISPGLVDAETNLLPVSGTREALFAIAQAVVDRSAAHPLVFMPNPFYQIYEGAALLAGASPLYLDCLPDNGFLPDLDSVDAAEWSRCQLIYICTPGNPTGAVMPREYLERLIELAQRYDFVIASDECYSEIYFDEQTPPPGLLGVAADMGNDRFDRCLAFHSLSKRSNLPGLRSGFVAGDARILAKFLLYRTYHGCALPSATQTASTAAWSDENHVVENRGRYRQKFEQVLALLSDTLAPQKPQAGFYLWASTPVSDTEFAARLYAEQNVTVLPGRFLSRDHDGGDPGENRVRMALVATLDECLDAANRINSLISAL